MLGRSLFPLVSVNHFIPYRGFNETIVGCVKNINRISKQSKFCYIGYTEFPLDRSKFHSREKGLPIMHLLTLTKDKQISSSIEKELINKFYNNKKFLNSAGGGQGINQNKKSDKDKFIYIQVLPL